MHTRLGFVTIHWLAFESSDRSRCRRRCNDCYCRDQEHGHAGRRRKPHVDEEETGEGFVLENEWESQRKMEGNDKERTEHRENIGRKSPKHMDRLLYTCKLSALRARASSPIRARPFCQGSAMVPVSHEWLHYQPFPTVRRYHCPVSGAQVPKFQVCLR